MYINMCVYVGVSLIYVTYKHMTTVGYGMTKSHETHMILEKLSSVKIMSPASLQTSVPPRPMAMPMSAHLRATASLVPSPVMPTTQPNFCNAWEGGKGEVHIWRGLESGKVEHL